MPSHNQDKAENSSLHNKDKATTSKRNDSELVATNHSSNSVTSSTHIFLPTAIVNIENSTGSLIPCRVLLDSGSQCIFITERILLVQTMN